MSASAAPAVRFTELAADPAWRCIEFLSDLHLCAANPQTFGALAQYLRTTRADAVFILGDLFEAWVGDDSRFDGFEAQATALLAEAGRHRQLGFMHGNRDFLIGEEWISAVGAIGLSDPTVMVAFGERVLITHGDALCLSDIEYQRFRAQVRNPLWQRALLARPLAQRRAMAGQMRSESEQRKQSQNDGDWVDLDPAASLQWMAQANARTLIHGHTHRPASQTWAPGFIRHVLSDWDFDHGTARADILRWQPSGLSRVALPFHADGASAP